MTEQLPQQILQEIEKRGLSPRPRWSFLLKKSIFWSLAVLSSVLGGVAVAIIAYVFFDHDPNAYKYLNQSPIEDILLAVPYFWIALLAIFAAVAKYGFRHTKTGYRYPTTKIIGIILGISLLLGLVLNSLDVGEYIDDYLTENVPHYDNLVHTAKDAWSEPDKGLLGGTIISKVSSTEFTLRDFKNNLWRISINKDELDNLQLDLGTIIKMVGVKGKGAEFEAKKIFLWGN